MLRSVMFIENETLSYHKKGLFEKEENAERVIALKSG